MMRGTGEGEDDGDDDDSEGICIDDVVLCGYTHFPIHTIELEVVRYIILAIILIVF